MSDKHKWEFAARFRRNAFGWRSDTPIQRIKEAVSEIKKVARKDPLFAAEGAVTFLEKLAPALEHVDGSSGAMGSAVNRAIEALVPIIGKAQVDERTRMRWLERLWQAIEDDGICYIECLSDHWGELCATPEIAGRWVAEFKPLVEAVWRPGAEGHGFFKGTTACLSAMYASGGYEELLDLLAQARHGFWHYGQWGVRALVALGRKAEAIRYAEGSRGTTAPEGAIAAMCEEILLSSGLADEAYRRYAIEANPGTTYLARFRAISKKYPGRPAQEILRDLVASAPGDEGKWFAAAKDAGLFGLALELVEHHPADPRTLLRAAREYAASEPTFARGSGLAALRWMSRGYGYDITEFDVRDAYAAVLAASRAGGIGDERTRKDVRAIAESSPPMLRILASFL